MAGRDLEAAPKLDGLIQSSTTPILLASTPPILPRWYLTDPSGRPLLADCQSLNPSRALKSSVWSAFLTVTRRVNLHKTCVCCKKKSNITSDPISKNKISFRPRCGLHFDLTVADVQKYTTQQSPHHYEILSLFHRPPEGLQSLIDMAFNTRAWLEDIDLDIWVVFNGTHNTKKKNIVRGAETFAFTCSQRFAAFITRTRAVASSLTPLSLAPVLFVSSLTPLSLAPVLFASSLTPLSLAPVLFASSLTPLSLAPVLFASSLTPQIRTSTYFSAFSFARS